MTAKRVICVSFDGAASYTRCAALRQAGYAVTSTTKITEAMDLLERESFDLAVIGHRFSAEEKRCLARTAKEDGDVPVVLVHGASPDKDIPADARVYALEGTEGILKAAELLLGSHKVRAA